MSFLKHELYKKGILLLAFVSLFLWAVTSSYLLLQQKDKLLVIGIDKNGTRVITRLDDPLFKTETVRFIQHFCALLYNFNQDTFIKNVGGATQYFGKKLWEAEKQKILSQAGKVKDLELSHSGRVVKISKVKPGIYQALIKGKLKSRALEKPNQLKVTIHLNKVRRSMENPWGLEVSHYDEKTLLN